MHLHSCKAEAPLVQPPTSFSRCRCCMLFYPASIMPPSSMSHMPMQTLTHTWHPFTCMEVDRLALARFPACMLVCPRTCNENAHHARAWCAPASRCTWHIIPGSCMWCAALIKLEAALPQMDMTHKPTPSKIYKPPYVHTHACWQRNRPRKQHNCRDSSSSKSRPSPFDD